MKVTVFTFLALITSVNLFSQVLKETFTDLDLNPGGIIYDAAYDEYSNTYIVVGDFTDIGTQTECNNIAFIDAESFQPLNLTPITSIDGPILTIEVYKDSLPVEFPIGNLIGQNRLFYIGGQFTNINGVTHTAAARFSSFHSYPNPPVNFSPYNLTTWDTKLFPWIEYFISDMTFKGDTIVMTGDFEADLDAPEFSDYLLTHGGLSGIIAFNPKLSGFGHVPLFEGYAESTGYTKTIYDIESFDNNFYIASSSEYSKYNSEGVFEHNFNFGGAGSPWPARDINISVDSDTLVLAWIKYAGGFGNFINENNGNSLIAPFGSTIPPVLAGTANGYQETYKNNVYTIEHGLIEGYKRNGIAPVNPVASFTIDAPYITNSDEGAFGWKSKRMAVTGSKLFISGDLLTNVDGNSKKGLAVFCLEPEDPKEFTSFDITICEGNIRTYTIPEINLADGYRWAYTGTGAKWRIPGVGVFKPLTDTIISNFSIYTLNSIEISFGTGTSGGTLTVQPFSVCNTLTDYQFAKEKSITLTSAPLPNISLAEDTMTFSCIRDSFYLISQSSTPNATFEWSYNSISQANNDSLLINLSSGVIDSTYYYGYVYESINGCRATDSVFVYYDTTPTPINELDITSTPPIFACNTNSLSLDLVIPNATIMWDLVPNADPPSLNTYTIHDANDSLTLYAYATYDANGCTAQQQYVITTDVATVPATLTGYTNFGSVAINDSLNCTNPTLNLGCEIVSGNGTAEWIIGGIPSGNTLNLSEADTLGVDLFGTNTYQFVTINTDNGCTDTLNATIKFDFDTPFISSYAGASSLNCSAISLELPHLLTGGSVIEGWLDATNSQTLEDTITINSVGEYYYQVESLINGCINSDTVSVIQTTELLLDLINDTLICPNQTANVVATPINNIETTAYTWSTGSTSQNTNITGGIDSQVTVIAQTVSGCIAYDTIDVLITAPIIANFIIASGCFDGSIQVSTVSGGAGNYLYSMDQTNWSTTTSFTGLQFGTYPIYIQDDLNCVYTFNETIDGSAQGLDVNFLVSTYNEEGDTLAIVNVSNFTGFDSLVWVLPTNAGIYSEDDSMVVLSIQSGGWYDVTLIGYQDTCAFSFTKSVHFGTEKPNFDDDYESVGIQSLSIYPNPTTGLFTVEIEYGVDQNYSIAVTNIQGQPVAGMSVSGIGNSVTESFTFPLGSTPGPYSIHIVSDYDAIQKTIILN